MKSLRNENRKQSRSIVYLYIVITGEYFKMFSVWEKNWQLDAILMTKLGYA
jgi:hypothetical protein